MVKFFFSDNQNIKDSIEELQFNFMEIKTSSTVAVDVSNFKVL